LALRALVKRATGKFQTTRAAKPQKSPVGAGLSPELLLGCPPVVGLLLIIQMPDSSDERTMALFFRPIDSFSLRLEDAEHVIRVIFDYKIIDTIPLRAPFRARFNVNIRH
jgi:hypothetical protein